MNDVDQDLVAPGYRPEYTGDNRLGDVGSGRALGANLYALYRAGRNELPGVAALYHRLVHRVHHLRDPLDAQFSRPGLGRADAHVKLLRLRDETHEVLRATCLRLLEVGQALVTIADTYAATDQEAADELTRILAANQGEYDTAPVRVPDPPGPGDPVERRPFS